MCSILITKICSFLLDVHFHIPRDKVVNSFIIKTAKVVNFFTVTTGKQIQCQVVKKFIDIHNQ